MKQQLITVLSLALAATTIAQIDLNRTVATINGEEIKGPEYYRRMEYLPGVGRMIGQNFAPSAPGFLAIDQLISERLLLQLAKEKGVAPTDAEVAAEIKQMAETNPKMMEQAAANGMNKSDIEYQVRLSLSQFKLQTRGITVTDQELEKHYKENPTRFTIPQNVELRIISVDNEATKLAVDADLKAGKPFVDAAKTHNTDPFLKATGGQLNPTPLETIDAEVRTALGKVKVGQVTEWIPTRGKYMKVLYEKATPARTLLLDEKLKVQLRRSLMMDRGRVKPENDIAKMMSNMRAKSKIEITDKAFAETYKKLLGAAAGAGG
ncbi:MAG: peptidyl-prolyl cis-trans isomerase [Fimbriimonadaceae bacterium]